MLTPCPLLSADGLRVSFYQGFECVSPKTVKLPSECIRATVQSTLDWVFYKPQHCTDHSSVGWRVQAEDAIWLMSDESLFLDDTFSAVIW